MDYYEQPESGFKEEEHLDFRNARIVYQGVEGAYSQQAMLEFFGRQCDSFHVDTFREAMEAIKEKKADYAVLPFENSSAGIIPQNYDMLLEYDAYIVGEQKIAVNHALLGVPGTKMEDITTVYSHPQALMQCSEYLEEHPWEKISYKNTAMAAKKIREDGRKDQAAIASRITAELYGLSELDYGIQNNKNNTTRFLIVSNRKVYEKNASKISICFEIVHESGSLYHILSHFYFNRLNMINIQSRPIPEQTWEYRFFVDFEGNFRDPLVKKALRRLGEDTVNMKILGTYQ